MKKNSFTLDVQRVHDVLQGRRTGRGCGKTVAVCVQAIGSLAFAHAAQFVVIVCDTPKMCFYVLDTLIDVAQSMGIQLDGTDKSNMEVRFKSMQGTVLLLTKHKATRQYMQPYGDSFYAVYVDDEVRPSYLQCQASAGDGECHFKHCPQVRDKEPHKTGRSCPLLWHY